MKNKPSKDFGVNLNFHPDRFYHCPLDKCKTAPLENPQKQLFIENPIEHFSLWLHSGANEFVSALETKSHKLSFKVSGGYHGIPHIYLI